MTTTPPALPQLLNNVGAPIDDVTNYQALLEDLQANILSSHGKPSAEYFFLRFQDSSAAPLLALLASSPSEREAAVRANPVLKDKFAPLFGPVLAKLCVSSEWQVSGGGSRGKEDRDNAVSFPLLVMLSATGYAKLGAGARAPDEPAFRAGMAARRELLNDPLKNRWDKGYADNDLDALVIVAFDPARGNGHSETIAAVAALLNAHVVRREQGFTRRDRSSDPIEPFGFRDNLSQPVFYARELRRLGMFQGKAATPKGGRWRSFEPLSSVLVQDPGGSSPHSCGSYVVFRKLRQDVEKFTTQVEALATKLDRPAGDVAADLVGRTREGWPLVATEDSNDMNDFDFSSDSRCPLHAHIRKANPRDSRYAPHERRIVRRGLTFETVGESSETGLLFLCNQSNIEKQFEVIQRWLNATVDGGADPIAGQPRSPNRIALRDRNGNVTGRVHAFDATVSMRGGEYFFMPSLSALKALR